jgi:hypothetical protein
VIARVLEIDRQVSLTDSEMVRLEARARQARAEADAFVEAQERRAKLSAILHRHEGADLRMLRPDQADALREQEREAQDELVRLPPLDRRRGEDACDESDRLTAQLLKLAERRGELSARLRTVTAFSLAEALRAVVASSPELAQLRAEHVRAWDQFCSLHAALSAALGSDILPEPVMRMDASSSPLAMKWRDALQALKQDPDAALPKIGDGDG